MNKLETIREKCVAANLDEFEFGIPRPIRLADVLLAIGDIGLASMNIAAPNIDYGKASFIWEPFSSGKHFIWNLREDDLSKQSEETIDFLYELLK